jgi:hypothetical protein
MESVRELISKEQKAYQFPNDRCWRRKADVRQNYDSELHESANQKSQHCTGRPLNLRFLHLVAENAGSHD